MSEISLGPSTWCISHRVACLVCFLLVIISSEICCGRSILVEQLESLPPHRIRVFVLIRMRYLWILSLLILGLEQGLKPALGTH